ncbi:flagellar motor protein MotP [Desulfosarcina ovata subsp. sediminis]|uniref:Flagellar motor protein MotP n=1 Tax=Desulfosarcina ovata subsp. sediminis TaxID=885957 RepID=A0A5K7ZTX3_9BACT|nr:MotA/TolQ/ExbB proton channel family protein [Desulfosarcina ovata]BBO83671.1 flagellar motor protein MotP [Desulfosarcina ovata subsp. sediminis]
MLKTYLLGGGMVVFGLLSSEVIAEIPLMVNFKSIALVVVGTLMGGLLCLPMRAFGSLWRSVSASLKGQGHDLSDLIQQITILARLQRVCELREFSIRIAALENPFLRRGLQQALDQRDRQTVEEAMENEMAMYLSGLQSHLGAIHTFARLAPVFGFVGTIIGLINVLNHLGNAAQIGHGMAIALLTTFYGLLFANLVFAPLAGKLAAHIHRETLMLNIVIEGVLAICDDRTPLEISHRLQSFLENDTPQPEPELPADSHPWQKLGAVLRQRGMVR